MLGGLCIDLETTIAGRIPDSVRPAGKKRFETRIIEIGAVIWNNPSITFGCLVNPLPKNVQINTVQQLKVKLRQMHQKPDNTIDFWSRVLVKRNSVSKSMLGIAPHVWLKQSTDKRCEDFVRWYNNPQAGPPFLSESCAFQQLCAFSKQNNIHTWYAHNGRSFDFKVLQGCALRTGATMPEITLIDTLRVFRRTMPNLPSYSQPILYKTIFNTSYNAHVAIDDAKALARLCKWADTKAGMPKMPRQLRSSFTRRGQAHQKSNASEAKKASGSKPLPMNLHFRKQKQRRIRRLAMKLVFRALR